MKIVVAYPARSSADPFAEVFQRLGVLRRYLVWARNLPPRLKPELAVKSAALGALRVAGLMLLPPKMGESWEYLLHPLFDRWARRFIEPGDWVFSSFGCANETFARARKLGGITLSNAGNSHPQFFWDINCEEHARWGVKSAPILRSQYRRALAMVEQTDYFFCSSTFVRESYLRHGIPAERLIRATRTYNPAIFHPPAQPNDDGVFRVVCPGAVNLRKGTIYLLQAFEKLRREVPHSELILSRQVREDCGKVIAPYRSMVTWVDGLPHPELARLFQRSSVFVLASIEEGLARTGLEAMACGLPAIVTPHTGVNDYVRDGETGFVVPIRDPQAIYEKLLLLATERERCRAMGAAAAEAMKALEPEEFARNVEAGLQTIAARVTR